MTERGPGGHDDDHLPEHILEDGIAPSVIGEGPPETPFEAAYEPYRPPAEPRRPEYRQEPPTSPIPALRPPEQQEKRKSWLGRMFRG